MLLIKIIILCLIAISLILNSSVLKDSKINDYEINDSLNSEATESVVGIKQVNMDYNYRSKTYAAKKNMVDKSETWLVGYEFGIVPEIVTTSNIEYTYVKKFRENFTNLTKNYGKKITKTAHGSIEFVYYLSETDKESLVKIIEIAKKGEHHFGTNLSRLYRVPCDSICLENVYFDCDGNYIKNISDCQTYANVKDILTVINEYEFENVQKKEVEFYRGFEIGTIEISESNLEERNTLVIPGWDYATDYTKDSAPVDYYNSKFNAVKNLNQDYKEVAEGINNMYFNTATENNLIFSEDIFFSEDFYDTNSIRYIKIAHYIEEYLAENPDKKELLVDEEKTAEYLKIYKAVLDDITEYWNSGKMKENYNEQTKKPTSKKNYFDDNYCFYSDAFLTDPLYLTNSETFDACLDMIKEDIKLYGNVNYNRHYKLMKNHSIYNEDALNACLIGLESANLNATLIKNLEREGYTDFKYYSNMIKDDKNLNTDELERILDMSKNAGYWYKLGWDGASKNNVMFNHTKK